MSHLQSHGRGGAGNFSDSSKDAKLDLSSLETPTIKADKYTTGRGGTGNMASNKDAQQTRAAQDVEA